MSSEQPDEGDDDDNDELKLSVVKRFTFDDISFSCDFESANIRNVEKHADTFAVWIKADAEGSPFEQTNRTWFYFCVSDWKCSRTLQMRIMNMNKQSKLFSTGFTPVWCITNDVNKCTWIRIPQQDVQYTTGKCPFLVTMRVTLPVVEVGYSAYFAFTYPYTYTQLVNHLSIFQSSAEVSAGLFHSPSHASMYLHSGCVCVTPLGHSIHLLTISSRKGIRLRRECEPASLRGTPFSHSLPFTFPHKPVVFISARVHPGETCSSYVLNGFLKFLMDRDNILAQKLLEKMVFKVVPMLNPDGVVLGHYRTDGRGVNLNRVYGDPDKELHPQIYAVKTLANHFSKSAHLKRRAKKRGKKRNKTKMTERIAKTRSAPSTLKPVSAPLHRVRDVGLGSPRRPATAPTLHYAFASPTHRLAYTLNKPNAVRPAQSKSSAIPTNSNTRKTKNARLCFYMDLHGHVSKGGAFVYGNHIGDLKERIEQLTFTKLLAICAEPLLDLNNCVFSELNMVQKDRNDESVSKQGAGRVAVFKDTNLTQCFTLECNYHGGKQVWYDRLSTANSNGNESFEFHIEEYEKVGKSLGEALYHYFCEHNLDNTDIARPRTKSDICRGWASRVVRKQNRMSQSSRSSVGTDKVKHKVIGNARFCAFEISPATSKKYNHLSSA